MKRRFIYTLNKGGGIQIDFAFSTIIFLTIFFVFYTMYNNHYISQNEIFDSSKLNALSRDICQILISTPGSPTNWESNLNNLKFAGLKNINDNELNSSKLNIFNNSNYWNILESYGIVSQNLKVKIIEVKTNTVHLDFGANTINYSIKFANSICFSKYDNKIVEVKVEVWE